MKLRPALAPLAGTVPRDLRGIRRGTALIAVACLGAAAFAGTVAGLVVDEQSAVPLSNVKVVLDGGPNARYQALTNAHGQFVVESVAPGVYSPAFDKDGYLPPEPGSSSLKPVIVAAGAEHHTIRAAMARLGTVTGRVVFEQSQAGIPVTVELRTVARGGSLVTRADADGNFRFDAVLPGRYYLAAIPGTYRHERDQASRQPPEGPAPNNGRRLGWVPAYYPGVSEPLQAQPIVVERGAQLGGYDLRLILAPVHTLRGRAVDDSGRTVAGARISLLPQRGLPESHAITTQDGAFVFESVRDGDWVLTASADRAGHPLAGVADLLVRGRDPDPVDIELAAPFAVRLEMVVEGEQAAPAPQVRAGFFLIPESGPALFSPATGSAEIAFPGVIAGRYRLLPTGGWRNAYLDEILLGGQPVLGVPLIVNASVAATPFRAIFKVNGGTVAGNGCSPGGSVILTPAGERGVGLFRSDTCDPSGRFRIANVRPGAHSIVAFHRFEADMHSPAIWTAIRNLGAPVKVEAGLVVEVEVRVSAAPAY